MKMTVILALGLALAGQALAKERIEAMRWRNVEIVAGGFIPGILFHPTQKGLAYLRTDIGGAYRLDPGAARWTPISDVFNDDEWNLTGIESIGLDPTDAQKVFLACGTYVKPWSTNGAILRSRDQGRSWSRTPLPFQFGGNEDGRSMGERLAVDPNLPSRLLFATRLKGLWESRDGAVSWKQVKSFPLQATTPNGIGLGFVTFDSRSSQAGQATKVIYVGAADPSRSLYRSKDGGKSWAQLPGGPVGLFPHHAMLDKAGTLYLTYANGPGPNGMSKGAVWKLDPAKDEWTEITPPGEGSDHGFAGLAVDAQTPGVLMVASMDRWAKGDEIWRSLDAGKIWKAVGPGAVRDLSASPYLYWGRPRSKKPGSGNWVGSLVIDPFDPDCVLYGTGATVMRSRDVTKLDKGKATHWDVGGQGVEETAVLDLVSLPEGPPLVSAIGDIGGFVHHDLKVSPPGGMQDPVYTTGTSLDFAEAAPKILVRCGQGVPKGQAPGSWSDNAGTTWKPFKSKPSSGREGGHIAVSADGTAFVWTLRDGSAHVSSDRGKTWVECAGLPAKAEAVADRKDSTVFYALAEGVLYRSEDKAQSFKAQAQGITHGVKVRVFAAPGQRGELWLAAADGLFQSMDAGSTFKRLKGVVTAEAIGFGKAAPGAVTPAIFMVGQLAGTKVSQVFRSDDQGKTWLRLNDDAHQWGWIGKRVTGDPRIYGRVYLATNGRGILWGDLESTQP